MSLLPSRGPDASAVQEGEMRIVGVDDDVDELLDALGSETARAVLTEIYEEPGTPSEIADRLDMSIQKVSYHLDKLEDRDLIAVAGTRYSEKGQEMTVYEPPEEPLALFVGTQDRKQSLRTAVRRLLPTIGILALASLVVQQLFGRGGALLPSFGGAGADGTDGQDAPPQPTTTEGGAETTATDGVSIAVDGTPTPQPTATPAPTDTVVYTTEGAAAAGLNVPPGLAFFLGGLLVLAIVGVAWAYRTYA